MKSFALTALVVVLAAGCSSAESDAPLQNGAAQTGEGEVAPKIDLFAACPKLNDDMISMFATVPPASKIVVLQENKLFGTNDVQKNLISPDVHYDITFAKEDDGSISFRMHVGPFAGIQRSIVSKDKRAVVSGKVVMTSKTAGFLDIQRRRDVLERISGNRKIDKLELTDLSCGSDAGLSFNLTAPVISLEAPAENRERRTDALGREVEFVPKVDWATRPRMGTLEFHPSFG
jgi:hypothetical protein